MLSVASEVVIPQASVDIAEKVSVAWKLNDTHITFIVAAHVGSGRASDSLLAPELHIGALLARMLTWGSPFVLSRCIAVLLG